MTPDDTQSRVNRLKELDKYAIPPDYGLHLQDWLSNQTTENTGCPLLDTPFLIIVSNDD